MTAVSCCPKIPNAMNIFKKKILLDYRIRIRGVPESCDTRATTVKLQV